MGIWRNIGKIVILLFQILHEQVKWYIGSYGGGVKRINPINKNKRVNILNEISRIKKENIIKRYEEQESRERMVDLCEKPYYDIKPE